MRVALPRSFASVPWLLSLALSMAACGPKVPGPPKGPPPEYEEPSAAPTERPPAGPEPGPGAAPAPAKTGDAG